MNAGLLNCRITLLTRGLGKDPAGQPIDTWQVLAKTWANIKYLSGTQALKADAAMSIAQASIMLRPRSGLAAGMRVAYGPTVFTVKAVLPDETKRDRVYLVCERA